MTLAMTLAEKISEVPELYDRSNDSTATLLKETGYLDAPQALKVEDVEEALATEPKLADQWLKRGHDQRLVGGWGIEREGGEYRIQNFDNGMQVRERNRLHATAEFIVRYVGFIGEVLRRHQRGRSLSGAGV
ncbi:MAG TPA: hypothetical protein VJ798_01615 [Rhizomicrobium sp.]|nr:hypothetical protein [Rhizomicrobium sp.]